MVCLGQLSLKVLKFYLHSKVSLSKSHCYNELKIQLYNFYKPRAICSFAIDELAFRLKISKTTM